jgi:nitroreductase
MEILEAIHGRRSIRKYTHEPVEKAVVEEIIRAGMMAPSAGNAQCWHFVVLRDRQKLEALSQNHVYASVVHLAPVAILVCGDLKLDKSGGYWVQDCAAATQNMLLAAHGMGLGSVWIGLYPREQRVADLRALLPLPDRIIPFSLLPLGYPDEEKDRVQRFNPRRIHFDKW